MEPLDKELQEFKDWYEENKRLFPPTNSHPTQDQRNEMFVWANYFDPKGNHKPSSCGRCYYNARTAIIRALKIF